MIKLYFVAIYFIFGYNVCSAQFAVVNDPDGYSNLREAPGKSKIITQLRNGAIVYGLPEYRQIAKEWAALVKSTLNTWIITNSNEKKYYHPFIFMYKFYNC
ncbi:hypothetical protein AMR72_04395 [Flavobacterium psychrophilum]|nr:hypothetical protein AMR72_04395 [Flavobacterium psychrophilum]AOE51821.1 hypothetical protein ALW18_04390 [Flavobacterium psychrophilum]